MKRAILLTVAVALSASFAWGALGDVVNSFPAPERWPWGLARANNPNYLWVHCHNSYGTIYRVNAYTGVVQSSFNAATGIATAGLTYSYGGGGGLPTGSYLWMGSAWTYYIYRCNYMTGSVYASFPAYARAVSGLAVKAQGEGGYCPKCMLSSNYYGSRLYQKDLITGSILSVAALAHNVQDLAWDWRNEIVWTGWGGNAVYGSKTNGAFVTSFPMPVDYPRGFCYWGQYLWVSTVSDHHIWQIHCPYPLDVDSAIVPASIGKVKATYR